MSQIRIMICRVNEKNPAEMTEIASYDLPETDIRTLDPEKALDEMEATLYKQGQAVLKRALQAQFEEIDRDLVEAYRQDFPPGRGDGRRTFGSDGCEPVWASGTETASTESKARAGDKA